MRYWPATIGGTPPAGSVGPPSRSSSAPRASSILGGLSRASSASGLLATSLKPCPFSPRAVPQQVVPPWFSQMAPTGDPQRQREVLGTFVDHRIADAVVTGPRGPGACAP
ncbi:unnamed protein product, partial [Polarella glacialis]